MKNTIKTILCICLAAMTAVSCENVLDKATISGRNTTNFPATEEEVQQMLLGVYSSLYSSFNDCDGANYYVFSNIASDDELGGGGPNDIDFQAMDRLLYSDPDLFADFWRYSYEGINRATNFLALTEYISDEELRNQLKGEALTLRAYFYFTLAKMFGDIPVIEDAASTSFPQPVECKEVFKKIADDLSEATWIMPSYRYPQGATGRVSRWAAEALLGQVFLFYTGFFGESNLPKTEGSVDIAFVTEKLKDCINNSGYELLPDYHSLWAYSNEETARDYDSVRYLFEGGDRLFTENNMEVIFEVCCSATPGKENKLLYCFGLRQPGMFPMNTGRGLGPVSANLCTDWATMQPEDPRRAASIEDLNTHGIGFNPESMEETAYAQKKAQAYQAFIDGELFLEAFSSSKYYGDGKTDLGLKHNPTNLALIRFADVLLMYSELTKDAASLNRVRARVGLPEVSYNDENLRNERRWELAFEGVRWDDLRRWKLAEAALSKQTGMPIINKGKNVTVTYPGYAERYKATNGFLDYPESVIQESEGLLQHKEGWEAYSAQFTRWQ